MKLAIIVILLSAIGITIGLAQLVDEHVVIIVTSEGKTNVSQMLFPKTFVSTIDVDLISGKISNVLAIDEKNILLGTTQNEDLLKIATLGASSVNLKYNADILSYKSGVFRLEYSSDLESRVNLPPLSKLVSLNTIPISISEKEYVLPPGDISLSFSIKPVTSNEFVFTIDNSEQKIEAITGAKIEEFSVKKNEIQFIIIDKAIILTIIPRALMDNPNNVILNGEEVDFSRFHQNSTHSWIRIDPHEKGLVKISNLTEKQGGGCLIATATFGSELAPQVQMLRDIRDNQLLNTGVGLSFMSGFNQFYYSFSPYIADYQRENQAFNETVKIAILPMLLSLSIMTNADSEEEVLGFGISVILINIGMYFVLPILLCYQGMKIIRTRSLNASNLFVISSKCVRSVLKTSLFGILALAVLSVSVSSVFNESAYADQHEDPIKTVLDITYQNILDSMEEFDEVPENADVFFVAGQAKYDEAIAALEAGDIVAAKDSAIVAMALFEDAAQEIGSIQEQASTQIPPGFGSAIDSASDTGISTGQGLGVGGVPPGVLKQITAANTFEIQEQIIEIDSEIEGLQNLIETSNLPVNLEKVNESVNLAKDVLMSGNIPDAQAKLALAKEIKDELYVQINQAVGEKEDERIQQFVDNSINNINEMLEKDNLGLTKKAIDELESTLAVLERGDIEEILDKTDDNSEFAKEVRATEESNNSENAPGQDESGPGNSENAPGQDESGPGNSENAPGQDESGPGNSENAPGQDESGPGNSENAPGQDESGPGNSENAPGQNNEDLPPGIGAAEDNPNQNAIENGNGLGIGNIPPGQLKKFQSYESSFEQSPDDFYENSFEASVDDIFEANFDGTNKGNGDGKGKFGAFPGKSGEAPGQIKSRIQEDKKGLNANFGNCGIPGNDPNEGPEVLLIGDNPQFISLLGVYVELDADVCDNVDDDQIPVTVGSLIIDDTDVNASVAGVYTVTYTATDSDSNVTIISRTVVVGDEPIFEVLDMNGNIQTSDFSTQVDIGPPSNDDTYFVGIIQNIFDNTGTNGGIIVDTSGIEGSVPSIGEYTVTYTVTDDDSNVVTITETVTVCNGECTTIPAQVTGLSANAISSSQIDLSWTAPADGGSAILGYQIEEKNGPWGIIVSDTGSQSTNYSITGLSPSSTHQYRVSAINSVGIGSASTSVTETTQAGGGGNILPTAVIVTSNLVLTEGDPGVLDGTGSFDSDGTITSYSWVKTGGDGGNLSLQPNSNVAAPTFTAPNVGPAGKVFEYTLTVIDNDGGQDFIIMTITINNS